jgi:hypothetical protein
MKRVVVQNLGGGLVEKNGAVLYEAGKDFIF